VNSAVGSALIAGILSGVFVIVGVLLGARLEGCSADQERARLVAGQRDEILASLAGTVTTLLTQATLWHDAAWRQRINEPFKAMRLPRPGQEPDDPRLARIEGEIERFRRDVVLAVSEISVLCSRLEHVEPVMQPMCEQLGSAVSRLVAATWGSDAEFKTRRDEVFEASKAMYRKRNELAEAGGPGGRHAEQGQQA
jgi:hypothetical protein